ncbi:MAG: acetyl-CoA carboxylase carboxyltransferase subunit alpha [Actinomycetia bacterium]|nr:acetyl-CoA carboxylase carboxyltransferase subunit alpha [Actinomycetes bacterium]
MKDAGEKRKGKAGLRARTPVRLPGRKNTDVARGLWSRCDGCERLIFSRDLEENDRVCPYCDHHLMVGARRRVEMVFDRGSFVPETTRLLPADPLSFEDSRGYGERLEASGDRSGLDEAVIRGHARLGGIPVVAAVMDFAFMGGSMGSVVGEAISRSALEAVERRIPLVVFCASGGARMQEGMISLMQMVKTAAAVGKLSDSGVPFISVLTHPTTGGVAASFATLADIILAEKGALVGFAGPRVIEQTVRQRLPEGFQSAEFCLKRGMVDAVVHRGELRRQLISTVRFLTGEREKAKHGAGCAPVPRRGTPGRGGPEAAGAYGTDPWDVVKMARHRARPRFLFYVEEIFDDFLELRGDRLYGDDGAIVGGFARLDGVPLVLIGHNRGGRGGLSGDGRATNDGMPHPEGIRKSLRLMKLAEKFNLPVVTMIDTPGAYPGVGAEERGQALAIAENLREMVLLGTPVLSVVIGEGGSGGALSLAVADTVLMMENSTFSVISPEGCAAILWRDSSKAGQAARALKLTAPELLEIGLIDAVVPEPPGGAHQDPVAAAAALRDHVALHLGELLVADIDGLVEARIGKYSRVGVFGEVG